MSTTLRNATVHAIDVAAPADRIYALLSDVGNWPAVFPPTIHAESTPVADGEELIHIWATAADHVKAWTSRRRLQPGKLRIDFAQEVPAAPILEMAGTWVVEPLDTASARVRLLHDYAAAAAADLEWIDRAVDTNSLAELAGLKRSIEAGPANAENRLDFADELTIDGSLRDVYDFINEAGQWAQRLPHVASVRLTETAPGVQFLEMQTKSPDGSTHTTASHRICFAPERIVYKQVTLPALMQMHTGEWTFAQDGGRVVASSAHSVVVDTANIERVLGPQASVEQAKAFVQAALSANSRATLRHAKGYAEARASRHATGPIPE
ncbi:MAG: aromatase/cyclase [Dermatophilaceae bacterium]